MLFERYLLANMWKCVLMPAIWEHPNIRHNTSNIEIHHVGEVVMTFSCKGIKFFTSGLIIRYGSANYVTLCEHSMHSCL